MWRLFPAWPRPQCPSHSRVPIKSQPPWLCLGQAGDWACEFCTDSDPERAAPSGTRRAICCLHAFQRARPCTPSLNSLPPTHALTPACMHPGMATSARGWTLLLPAYLCCMQALARVGPRVAAVVALAGPERRPCGRRTDLLWPQTSPYALRLPPLELHHRNHHRCHHHEQ